MRLSAAVDSGRLTTSFVLRSLDEQVIPEKTHIYFHSLVGWLEERDYEIGERMNEWTITEADICSLVCDEVIFLRTADRSDSRELSHIERQRTAARYGWLNEGEQLDEIKLALKSKEHEIVRLKEELALCQSGRPAKVDRPLHIRQRRTLLTIIAALCHAAGIDYTKRGAAQRIKDNTELVGAPIDDGTILKLIDEIPDALETRMK